MGLENRGEGHLRPFADAAETRALTQLEEIFARGKTLPAVPARIRERVLASASADFAALWPALLARAEAEAEAATQKLAARGELAARSLRGIIEVQRGRIERAQQLGFGFENPSAAETEQIENERDPMKRRLAATEGELESEPAQWKVHYGLVYPWPATNFAEPNPGAPSTHHR